MSSEFFFDQSPKVLFDLICDPDFLVERSIAIGEVSADAEIAEDADGVIYITMRREVDQELPPFLAKLFNSRQVLNVEEEWTQDGNHFNGTSLYQVEGKKVSVSIVMSIQPSGSGSMYRVSHKPKADIPLMKKKIEAFIKSNCENGAKKEAAYMASKLA